MNGIKSKMLCLSLVCILIISSLTEMVSAAENNGNNSLLDVEVPDGYQVIKQYNTEDKSSIVDSPIDVTSLIQGDNTLLQNGVTGNAYGDGKVTENETFLYRELQNPETGEVMQQYVSDVTIEPLAVYDYGGSKLDPAGRVKLTIRLHYHTTTKDGMTFIGLDKIYYRYDIIENPNGRVSVHSINGTVLQWGPGINGYAQTQEQREVAIGYTPGETNLINLKDKGWVDVLEGGLNTQLGLKLNATINRGDGTGYNFSWQLLITGKVIP
ncbi:hypothetical protein SAMN04488688_104487 [Paenibacillus sp. cl141a]|uniref:hypothetical protein n=1 Tax=Paenibacillus sp. cl141a TaxID=1761877 RepID=UPI0008B05FCE|nr:hypothetical protein [Paenibacillus sp. cl141a]SEL58042.1 hypothetical protein SAMN04488688_104487 [Paenibacillus sp. cl141a]